MKRQFRFSLFYNMSATRVQRKWHKCDTNATEWDTIDTSATRVKIFDFDNDTSENIFSHSRISYMTNERPQGEEQFHSKNYLLEIPCSHVKTRLKSAPQKLNFVMAKATSKCYTRDCSCKCPCMFQHSFA